MTNATPSAVSPSSSAINFSTHGISASTGGCLPGLRPNSSGSIYARFEPITSEKNPAHCPLSSKKPPRRLPRLRENGRARAALRAAHALRRALAHALLDQRARLREKHQGLLRDPLGREPHGLGDFHG